MRRAIVMLTAIVLLAVVNLAFYARESLLRSGRVVFLEIEETYTRPSLFGQQLTLRLQAENRALAEAAFTEPSITDPAKAARPSTGWSMTALPFAVRPEVSVIVAVDAQGVATRQRVDDDALPAPNEIRLPLRFRYRSPIFTAETFAYAKPRPDEYAATKYAEFRVADDGRLLLRSLRDENFAVVGVKQNW